MLSGGLLVVTLAGTITLAGALTSIRSTSDDTASLNCCRVVAIGHPATDATFLHVSNKVYRYILLNTDHH